MLRIKQNEQKKHQRKKKKISNIGKKLSFIIFFKHIFFVNLSLDQELFNAVLESFNLILELRVLVLHDRAGDDWSRHTACSA
jgi:hypothetical protein